MSLLSGRFGKISISHLSRGRTGRRRQWFPPSKRVPLPNPGRGSSSLPRRGLVVKEAFASSAIDHPGVARSVDYIARHWRDAIGVMDLVRVARMSRRGFLKAFGKHAGGTPGRRLRVIRLEHACKLLRESDDKPENIARRCGYRSLNSFMIAFKRDVGVAPVQYRENQPAPGRARRNRSHGGQPTQNFKSPLQKA